MSDRPLRLVFMGSAELACASLRALHETAAVEVLAVVTQPDKPKGRDLKPQPTPVGQLAAELQLPLHKPLKARSPEFIDTLNRLAPDLIVVVAYGQLLPQTVLDVPRFGCLNVHTSLLPKYRGAAPIQWAIHDGESETGVTLMKMDAGLDTGDMLATAVTPIHDTDDAQTLHDRLAQLGAALLIDTLPRFVAGEIVPRPQPAEGSTYARKISREDGRVDWSRPARDIWNQVRAFYPWPGAFTFLPGDPKPVLLKIWRVEVVEEATGTPGIILSADQRGLVVAAGRNAVRLVEVQREGGRRMSAAAFVAGTRWDPGVKLG